MNEIDIDALLAAGTARHQAGDLPGARRVYEQVLAADASKTVARFRLGLLELQEGNHRPALALVERAAGESPHDAKYQMGLGEVLTAMGRWDAAAAAYRRVLAVDPSSEDAHFALGLALQSAGDCSAAITEYRAVVELRPDYPEAFCNLGSCYSKTGDPPRAESAYREALRLRPTFAEAAYNLGLILIGKNQPGEAIELFRKAVDLRPDYADAWLSLGNVCNEQGRYKQAALAFESALRARPGFTAAINNICFMLRRLGRLEEAETHLVSALQRDRENAVLHDTLGNVLKDSGRLDEAIACFRRAVELDPGNAVTHSNLVCALSFQSADGLAILEESRRWDRLHAAPVRPARPMPIIAPPAGRRVRIGYVSPDFRDHCQSLFTVPLLSHHDHQRFEIFCYSSVDRPDAMTRRLVGFADRWREVAHLDDAELCELIRADGIDVLVDLTMHMARCRPLLFARRAAPVQVAWLAYPGTTGIAAMDYRFSDPRLDPPGFEDRYTERTVRLPDSFWCYDPLTDQPLPNRLPALESGQVTFGCLNNPCKLTDRTIQLCGGVLRALPDARLLLMSRGQAHQQRLQRQLGEQGVEAHRIEFVPHQSRDNYLRAYHRIDLGLDTFPYNGHTTSLDSFWMGVPVVSRVGRTCVGRGGLSQLFQLDLLELAAHSDEGFVNAAVTIAKDLPRLAVLRQQLRTRLEKSPLMDAARFARNVESAYLQLVVEHPAVTPT